MKYLLLLTLVSGLVSTSSLSQERYFHELKGFEDSTQTTQLFYRLNETQKIICSTLLGTYKFFNESNSIFHFSTDSLKETFFFRDSSITYCNGIPSEKFIFQYDFYNAPSNWIVLTSNGEGGASWFQDFSGTILGFPFPIAVKTTTKKAPYYPGMKFILSNKLDSLYYLLDELTIPFASDTSQWPNFGDDYEQMIAYFDSTHFDYRLLGIHPKNDSLYFGVNSNGHLYRSEKYSSNFVLADSSTFYSDLFFDQNPSYIYGRNRNTLRISDDCGLKDSWTQVALPDDMNRLLFATTDTSTSGSLFIADSNQVFHSTDFGSSFQNMLSFDSQITGLYKKPNSEILYVLTRTNLYKVENGQATSIKQVPVSNEKTPIIPTSVSLKQNYPNPFNPTTTIQFELDKATFTKLTVYDVLGRKIQQLVSEVRPAGTNTIQFDATNLASGVYLYRLEANGVTQTKRLTLIK